MYYYQQPISYNLKKKLVYYYKELYENYETKTVYEIATELNVHHKIIYTFINICYQAPINENGYSTLMTLIMLCTKFDSSSQFYEEQQENFGELIRKRAILKEVKMRNKKLNEKRKVKRLQK